MLGAQCFCLDAGAVNVHVTKCEGIENHIQIIFLCARSKGNDRNAVTKMKKKKRL